MDAQVVLYLAVTAGIFAVFAALVFRTYRRRNRDRMESAKYRMMEDDCLHRNNRDADAGSTFP